MSLTRYNKKKRGFKNKIEKDSLNMKQDLSKQKMISRSMSKICQNLEERKKSLLNSLKTRT